MVKQLGLPRFFLTLSCADLRWKELILIISRLHGLNLDEKNSEIDYFQKCEILNSNPVLVARHFQYRVETFFKEIILHKNSPLSLFFGTKSLVSVLDSFILEPICSWWSLRAASTIVFLEFLESRSNELLRFLGNGL